MSTFIKNNIFDNADFFGCLDLVKKGRYWGMDGLITKFHHIAHFRIDFFIASVDINVFLKAFEQTIVTLVFKNLHVDFTKAF